jgi:hypothetical protein
MAARESAAKLRRKRAELTMMADVAPPPTREVAAAVAADLVRAKQVLGELRSALESRGQVFERMQKAKAPAARTDAYFDLATFVERMTELTRKAQVDVYPEAARFGFAAYATEAPEQDRLEQVFRQRQVMQHLLELLVESHPKAILDVKREAPLTKKEKEDAAAALANGAAGEQSSLSAAARFDGNDYFTLDRRMSVRSATLDTTAFRIAFTGNTATLRMFLNRVAAFEVPVVVREVEVKLATGEDALALVAGDTPSHEENTSSAPSIVLTLDPPKKSSATKPKRDEKTSVPLVPSQLSRFTVTLEYLEQVPPPAGTF